MKIKILFCIDLLNMTGATASLIALLRKLDYTKYEVSLFRFDYGSAYLDQIPPQVHQLPLIKEYVMYVQGLRQALVSGWRNRWIWLALKRLVLSLGSKVSARFDKLFLAKCGPALEGEYDVAIAYCCSYMWEFVCTKVNAKKRVAWLDTDHRRVLGLSERFVLPYDWDKIACVSRCECDSVLSDYPEFKGKVTTVHNISDKSCILKRAMEYTPNFEKNKINLVTVGRVTVPKGQDLIIKMAIELKRRGISFVWYLIGPGEQIWQQYLGAAGNPNLSDCIVFLGGMENPYPYMKCCDLYVQPSRWEGYGMAVNEALACGVPILVSDIPAFHEQVVDGENGWIVPLDVSSFTEKIIAVAEGRATLTNRGGWQGEYSTSGEFDRMIANMV